MNQHNRGTVYSSGFSTWAESLPPLLERSGVIEAINSAAKPVLVKPNLVEALEPPITTPVGLIQELISYLRQHTGVPLIIGEGSGAIDHDTGHAFATLGYSRLADEFDVRLVDLNHEEQVHLRDGSRRRWPEIYLPRLALESFLLSVPVLKAHSMAGVTLTMKNMIGLAPPAHYRRGNSWQKSAFHETIQEAVADLNRYRTPDFTLLDATVGMPMAHLWGPHCDPPLRLLAAGFDPVAMDAYGASLLQRNWQRIGHISSVHGELGSAEPLTVVDVAE